MKRKIISILLLFVLILPIFSGCGCTGLSKLSFNNNFNGGTAPGSDFTEKLTYKVEFSNDAENYYGVSPSVSAKADRNYSDGEYTSELKVVSSIKQDVKNKCEYILDNTNFYYLTTTLSITVDYAFSDGNYSHTDEIISEVYFYPASKHFAPIYSKTTSDQYIMVLDGNNLSLASVVSESEIIYGENNYSVVKGAKTYDLNGELVNETSESNNYSYEFGTVIDNAELLFAIRNMDLSNGDKTLPVVEASYGKYTNLLISNTAQKEKSMIINGIERNVKYNDVSFRVNENKASGSPQKISIETEGISNKNLPVLYARPIITSGTIAYAGTLLFTLTNIE